MRYAILFVAAAVMLGAVTPVFAGEDGTERPEAIPPFALSQGPISTPMRYERPVDRITIRNVVVDTGTIQAPPSATPREADNINR
jgi:hypothetical protein